MLDIICSLLPACRQRKNKHTPEPLMEEAVMMGADQASSSSTRQGIEEMERVNSSRPKDIAIQVQNDVIASFAKIDEGDESIKLIPRVPESLRQGANGAYYDPQVISIGPYHWGKPQLEAMEKQKRRYLRELLSRNPERRLQDYIDAIESLEPRLRSCYHKDIQVTSEDFVEMMLVDGCFVVEFNLQWMDRLLHPVGINPGQKWLWSVMRYDMLLLENQLPFFLLQRIYDIAATTTTKENLAFPSSFIQVAIEFFSVAKRFDFKHLLTPVILRDQLPKTIHHFIHLDHSIFTSYYYAQHHMFAFDVYEPASKIKEVPTRQIIPSATELHDLGIKFKKYESNIPYDIKFHRGVMEIKPLDLNNWSARRILNQVAFERLYFEDEPCFINYFKFMDLLINTSSDVALLRRYGIIRHEFGSDEEIALFFSHLTRGILNHRLILSSRLYERVNEYCNIKRHRWRASLIRDYCSSPWSTLGLVVGFILLALTFVQSYMSLHSYFRPPHS